MLEYSQSTLLQLLKEGKYPGESGVPKHIETVISNVFVFDTRVYKVYKNDNDFYNNGFRDISGKEARFAFTLKDYAWNHVLSPSIYIDTHHVAVLNDLVVRMEGPDDAEEMVIVMNKIDTNDVLFEVLVGGSITEEDCFSIGKQLGEHLRNVQGSYSNDYNYYTMFKSRIEDMKNWISSVNEYIPLSEVDAYCDFLSRFLEEHKDLFEHELTEDIVSDGDFHSHNGIFSEGKFLLMDTYPPKEEWGIGHRLTPVYRIGVDVWALTGKKRYFEALLRGYEEGNQISINRSLDDMYVVYCCGISVPYLYMLNKTDSSKMLYAKRFHDFMRNYFANTHTH